MIGPTGARQYTDHEIRTTAIEHGLYARKVRGRDGWTVEHPDGRVSVEVTAAGLMAALEPAGREAPVLIAGENFGSHRECRWTRESGTRTVRQMWDDLCREHDATAPIPVQLRPEVTARLNRQVVPGGSLGEVPHGAAGCHEGGRPHLGPCVDVSAGGVITDCGHELHGADGGRCPTCGLDPYEAIGVESP